MSRVERIVESRSALEAFAERAEALDAGDAAGWAELARWAEERELLTQARLAWQRVLATDPGHAAANAGLGRVALGGEWMSAEDAYRARGFVSYEGRWLTPAEHEAAVREREADQAAARGQREADLRVQEAEARVREAEARASEAEAAADQAGGIPLGYAYGGYGYGYGWGAVVPPYVQGHRGRREMRPDGPRQPRSHPGSPHVRPAPAPRSTSAPRPQTRASQPPPRRQAAILPPPTPSTASTAKR
jgi:hypothetical protein